MGSLCVRCKTALTQIYGVLEGGSGFREGPWLTLFLQTRNTCSTLAIRASNGRLVLATLCSRLVTSLEVYMAVLVAAPCEIAFNERLLWLRSSLLRAATRPSSSNIVNLYFREEESCSSSRWRSTTLSSFPIGSTQQQCAQIEPLIRLMRNSVAAAVGYNAQSAKRPHRQNWGRRLGWPHKK